MEVSQILELYKEADDWHVILEAGDRNMKHVQ